MDNLFFNIHSFWLGFMNKIKKSSFLIKLYLCKVKIYMSIMKNFDGIFFLNLRIKGQKNLLYGIQGDFFKDEHENSIKIYHLI